MTAEHPVVERERLLIEGSALLDQLLRQLDAFQDDDSVHTDGLGWRARDVFAHLARWHVRSLEEVTCLAAGNVAPELMGGDDEINARWVEVDRLLTRQQARDWCIQSADVLRRALLALSPGQWEAFGRSHFADVNGDHYRGHLGYLKSAG